jgi:VWFA-related protein
MKPLRLLTALLLLAATALAQPANPSTVIQTETRLVLVDTVVNDHKGNPVRDLSAKDFRVWDDNREQTIRSFSLEPEGGAAASAYTILFFDNPRLDSSGEARVRGEAAKFVEANAAPTNLIEVAELGVALQITQRFTSDTQILKQAISRIQMAGPLAQDGPAVNGRSATNPQAILRMLEAIGTVARDSGSLPGRKTMILFSSSLPMNSAVVTATSTVVNLCNRVNVSLYPVDTAGLVTPFDAGAAGGGGRAGRGGGGGGGEGGEGGGGGGGRGGRGGGNMGAGTAQAPIGDHILHELAKGTGGFVSQNSNDVAAIMGRIFKEQRVYYLLGYVPPDSLDGSCHALRVKVDRGGVDVRARNSYCNVKPVDLLAAKPVERDLENRAAGAEPGNIGATMQLPFFYEGPGLARLNVAMEIPSSCLRFEKVKGRFHAEANVMGIAYAADGSVAARFSDTVKLDFAEQKDLDTFHASPLHYEKQLSIAPGRYNFRAVFSAGAEKFARLEAPLVIDQYDGQQFMVSSLALSKDARPAAELGGGLDEELFEDRRPLMFRGLRVVPSGTNQFQKTDTAVIYLEVYEPRSAAAAPPGVELRLRVLDRQTGAEEFAASVPLDAAAVAGKTTIPYGLRLRVDALPPAWYRYEVQAIDSTGKSMTRSVEFEVRP